MLLVCDYSMCLRNSFYDRKGPSLAASFPPLPHRTKVLSLIITAFCPTDCDLGCAAKSQWVGPWPLSQAAGSREREVQTRGPRHLHIPCHRARNSLEHKRCISSPCSQSEDILRGEWHVQVFTVKGRIIQVFWFLVSFPSESPLHWPCP